MSNDSKTPSFDEILGVKTASAPASGEAGAGDLAPSDAKAALPPSIPPARTTGAVGVAGGAGAGAAGAAGAKAPVRKSATAPLEATPDPVSAPVKVVASEGVIPIGAALEDAFSDDVELVDPAPERASVMDSARSALTKAKDARKRAAESMAAKREARQAAKAEAAAEAEAAEAATAAAAGPARMSAGVGAAAGTVAGGGYSAAGAQGAWPANMTYTPGAVAGPPPGPRKARLAVSRIDPWSVMKLSFLLSVAIGIMTVVASIMLWFVVDRLGIFAQLQNLINDAIGQQTDVDLTQFFAFDRVVSLATLVAVINVVLLTAIATIISLLYNVTAALVGGVHVTLTDD